MYDTRRIYFDEMRRLHMAHDEWATEGTAVIELDENGKEARVVDWYADRQDAISAAETMNAEDE